MRHFDVSLYLVTDRGLSRGRSNQFIVEEAVKGGVTMVQLREKEVDTREFYQLAVSLKEVLRPLNIPLIINDRLDIALAVDADGLHIGQHDLPCEVSRRILGRNKIIGLSVETIQQARDANSMDVDYIGLSPIFTTATKEDTSTPLGLGKIREIAAISKHVMVAIGGINATNAAAVIAHGADGIAVVSAIVSHDDPQMAARELRKIVNQAKS